MIAAAAPTGRAFRGVSGSGGCAVITAIIHHPQIARNSSIYYFAQGPEPRHDTPGNPQIKPQNYRPDTDSMSGVLVTGILVRPDDVDAMPKAIAYLMADPDRAAEMGKAAAEDVGRRFTSGIMAKHLAEIALSI
jgi:glycosyltransferase involved in cell wall biosynthesis